MPESPVSLLGVDQVAELLGVTPRLVRELRARRELPAILVGRLLRFDRADIADFIAAQRQPALHGPLADSLPARPARRRSTTGARS